VRSAFRALVLAAIGAMSFVAPVPANASTQSCPPDYDYTWSQTSSNHIDMVSYATAPGGHTLSISIARGDSIGTTVGGSLQTGTDVLIASAKVEVSASISQSITATVTYTDSWTVPSGASYGELHAGASRYYSHWTYGHYTPTCSWVVNATGTANMPYHVPTFWSVVHS
jgi:hypothetical protein